MLSVLKSALATFIADVISEEEQAFVGHVILFFDESEWWKIILDEKLTEDLALKKVRPLDFFGQLAQAQ